MDCRTVHVLYLFFFISLCVELYGAENASLPIQGKDILKQFIFITNNHVKPRVRKSKTWC